jgi:hypothetical protein
MSNTRANRGPTARNVMATDWPAGWPAGVGRGRPSHHPTSSSRARRARALDASRVAQQVPVIARSTPLRRAARSAQRHASAALRGRRRAGRWRAPGRS